jgi:hypothetical protein
MIEEGRMSHEAKNFLVELGVREEEFVMGAYDKFLEDGDQEDFKDTLLRFVVVRQTQLMKASGIGEETEEEEEEEEEDYSDDEDSDDYSESEDGSDDYDDTDDDSDEDAPSDDDYDASAPLAGGRQPAAGLTIPTGFHDAIIKLLKHGRITKDAATALLTAMANGNQVLGTIYKAFTVNKDAKAFLAMIVHLVTPEEEGNKQQEQQGQERAAKASQQAPPAAPSPRSQPQPVLASELSSELKDRFGAVFKQCLQLLIARGMVTQDGALALLEYAQDNMPSLMVLLEEFNTTADLDSLLEELKDIAGQQTRGGDAGNAGNGREEEGTKKEEDKMADEKEQEEVDEQLIKVLTQCIEVRKKTHTHTHTHTQHKFVLSHMEKETTLPEGTTCRKISTHHSTERESSNSFALRFATPRFNPARFTTAHFDPARFAPAFPGHDDQEGHHH